MGEGLGTTTPFWLIAVLYACKRPRLHCKGFLFFVFIYSKYFAYPFLLLVFCDIFCCCCFFGLSLNKKCKQGVGSLGRYEKLVQCGSNGLWAGGGGQQEVCSLIFAYWRTNRKRALGGVRTAGAAH